MVTRVAAAHNHVAEAEWNHRCHGSIQSSQVSACMPVLAFVNTAIEINLC